MHRTVDMGCRPSELMDIDDPYTAFCFDETCAYIIRKINDGEEPIIHKKETKKKSNKKQKASDIYAKYSNVTIHK